METSKYNCSQPNLYSIGRLALTNYNTNLSKFTAFRPRYTQAYGDNLLEEISAAEKLPSDDARSGIGEKNRILLSQAADDCLMKWQNLKRYILDAFQEEQSASMLKVAGQFFYSDAANLNWDSVAALVNHGAAFISEYQGDLIANDNMPPSFGDDFDVTKTLFLDLQAKFFGAVSNTTQHTQAKIKANNAIYEKLAKILQDGQQIFVKDDGLKQQFVFANLKSIVNGVSQAGVRGYVTDAVSGMPINAATLTTANAIYTSITDADGRFDLKNMAAGDYKLTIAATGYISLILDITVKTGTVSTQNIVLAKTVD